MFPVSSSPFSSLILSIFRLLDEKNVDYLVLRNYETLPEMTTNDVDLLIQPKQRSIALTAVSQASKETGWYICNVVNFSCTSVFLYHEDTLEQTHIDLMCGVKWHSMIIADHVKILENRVAYQSFYIPAPEYEAHVSLLTRLVYGGYVKEKFRPFIARTAAEFPDAFQCSLQFWIGKKLSRTVVDFAQSEQWSRIEELAPVIRFRILLSNLRSPFSFAYRIYKDVFRAGKRFFSSPGLAISILGTNMEHRLPNILKELSATFREEKLLVGQAPWFIRKKTLFRAGLVVSTVENGGIALRLADTDSPRNAARSILQIWKERNEWSSILGAKDK